MNLWCLYLLNKLKNKDVNLRAATTFSFNDFISNGGIVVAGIVVLLTGANWPDLIVGIAVACIAVYGGFEILRMPIKTLTRNSHSSSPCTSGEPVFRGSRYGFKSRSRT